MIAEASRLKHSIIPSLRGKCNIFRGVARVPYSGQAVGDVASALNQRKTIQSETTHFPALCVESELLLRMSFGTIIDIRSLNRPIDALDRS